MNSLIAIQQLPDGRIAHVMPLTYGRARIGVGENPEERGYDDVW